MPGHGVKVVSATQRNMMAKGGFLKDGSLAKAGPLDVGTNTNFSQISGGQSLGYVSLDTQLARGTIRPDSFSLYQALPKSAAFQIVDYWAYTDDIGGGPVGTNFAGFGNVSSGTLSTTAGKYNLMNVKSEARRKWTRSDHGSCSAEQLR